MLTDVGCSSRQGVAKEILYLFHHEIIYDWYSLELSCIQNTIKYVFKEIQEKFETSKVGKNGP